MVTYKEYKGLDKSIVGDNITIKLPLEKRFASVLRLAVSAVAAKMDFNWEQIEDLKLAAEEAFLLCLKAQKQPEIEIIFYIKKEGLEIILENTHLSADMKETSEERYSFFILTGLMDDVIVEPALDKSFNLKMMKKFW